MIPRAISREELFYMAAEPIGSPELQREADRNREALASGALKPSAELKEAGQRASKRWLPAGKKSAAEANRKAAEDCAARQTDLEDAVEAAGGARGS